MKVIIITYRNFLNLFFLLFSFIKELSKNLAPRTTQKPVMDINVERGNDVHLPCNIQGNPFPIFT